MHRPRYVLLGLLGAAIVLVLAATLAPIAGSTSQTAPQNVAPPEIVGTAQEGQTLFAEPGKWTGTKPITFSAQWLRCDTKGATCVEISGANKQQYKLVAADVGKTARIRVNASNKDGKETANSKQTAVIAEATALPKNTSPPTISGKAQVGETMTADKGTWTGGGTIDYNYYWERCADYGGACSDISGATASTYKLTSADKDNTVRVRVKATNSAGSVNALSAASPIIEATGGNLPEGAIKLPDGKVSIPASSVPPDQRLDIAGLDFSPNPLKSRSDPITARFRIFDTRGYVVRDVLVYVIPLPYNWTSQPAEVKNGEDGWATVHMTATDKLPKNSAIVMFVRARRASDPVLTGISNRRLVQLVVKIP